MSDRELDVAVAKAMGCSPRSEVIERNGPMELWHCGCPGKWHYDWPHGCNEEGMDSDLCYYSTDSACVGTMLEWAAAKGLFPSLHHTDKGWRVELSTLGDSAWGKVTFGGTPAETLAKAIASLPVAGARSSG